MNNWVHICTLKLQCCCLLSITSRYILPHQHTPNVQCMSVWEPVRTKQNLWMVVMRFEKLRQNWRFSSLYWAPKIELWFVKCCMQSLFPFQFLKIEIMFSHTEHNAHTKFFLCSTYKSSFPCFSIIKQARRMNFGKLFKEHTLSPCYSAYRVLFFYLSCANARDIQSGFWSQQIFRFNFLIDIAWVELSKHTYFGKFEITAFELFLNWVDRDFSKILALHNLQAHLHTLHLNSSLPFDIIVLCVSSHNILFVGS